MKYWLIVPAIGLAYLGYSLNEPSIQAREASQVETIAVDASVSNTALKHAFEQRKSSLLVKGRGQVIKLLPDDQKGSRHQRFIVKVNPQQTVLIAHNIDLAPRIEYLAEGDEVTFSGEYEWNSKGGVVHWTHHDPQGHHPDGWLQHEGQIYQ